MSNIGKPKRVRHVATPNKEPAPTPSTPVEQPEPVKQPVPV